MTRSDTSDLFAKCFTRIDRAVQHSNEVADAWNNFDVGGLHGVSLSIESDGTGELNVRQLEPLPQALEVSLGEYLYQLRAALDGAVYRQQSKIQGKTRHRRSRLSNSLSAIVRMTGRNKAGRLRISIPAGSVS